MEDCDKEKREAAEWGRRKKYDIPQVSEPCYEFTRKDNILMEVCLKIGPVT